MKRKRLLRTSHTRYCLRYVKMKHLLAIIFPLLCTIAGCGETETETPYEAVPYQKSIEAAIRIDGMGGDLLSQISGFSDENKMALEFKQAGDTACVVYLPCPNVNIACDVTAKTDTSVTYGRSFNNSIQIGSKTIKLQTTFSQYCITGTPDNPFYGDPMWELISVSCKGKSLDMSEMPADKKIIRFAIVASGNVELVSGD